MLSCALSEVLPRDISLLLLILIDPIQHSIHLLLQKSLELLDHDIIDWALLHEVSNKALNGVSVIYDDPLQAEVSHVNINIELRFSLLEYLRLTIDDLGLLHLSVLWLMLNSLDRLGTIYFLNLVLHDLNIIYDLLLLLHLNQALDRVNIDCLWLVIIFSLATQHLSVDNRLTHSISWLVQ